MGDTSTVNHLLLSARADDDGVDHLFARYRPALKLIAEQLTGDKLRRREDASDIVQRTLVDAYQAFSNFSGATEEEFSAWIKQILRRNASSLGRDHRAAKRDVRRELHIDDAGDSLSFLWHGPAANGSTPSSLVVKAEDALNLAQAIESMPADQQLAVTMRYLHDTPVTEIAAAMGKTTASVAGLLRRGLECLRSKLADVAANA